MQPWPMFVIIWFCVFLFIATGILSFLDTAGLRKIPYPSRSKVLFSALLLQVIAAGATIFKHYSEQGTFPVFFNNLSTIKIDEVRELPISEQHSIEVVGANGARLNLFCNNVKVKNADGKSLARFTISADGSDTQAFEIPAHAEKQFIFAGKTYVLHLDGVIDWQQRADDAFISIRSFTAQPSGTSTSGSS